MSLNSHITNCLSHKWNIFSVLCPLLYSSTIPSYGSIVSIEAFPNLHEQKLNSFIAITARLLSNKDWCEFDQLKQYTFLLDIFVVLMTEMLFKVSSATKWQCYQSKGNLWKKIFGAQKRTRESTYSKTIFIKLVLSRCEVQLPLWQKW